MWANQPNALLPGVDADLYRLSGNGFHKGIVLRQSVLIVGVEVAVNAQVKARKVPFKTAFLFFMVFYTGGTNFHGRPLSFIRFQTVAFLRLFGLVLSQTVCRQSSIYQGSARQATVEVQKNLLTIEPGACPSVFKVAQVLVNGGHHQLAAGIDHAHLSIFKYSGSFLVKGPYLVVLGRQELPPLAVIETHFLTLNCFQVGQLSMNHNLFEAAGKLQTAVGLVHPNVAVLLYPKEAWCYFPALIVARRAVVLGTE